MITMTTIRLRRSAAALARSLAGIAGAGLLMAAVACAADTPAPPAVSESEPAPTRLLVPTLSPDAAGADEAAGADAPTLRYHLATKVLETGTQRVAFLLTTAKGLVNAPQAQIAVSHQDGGAAPAPVIANYHEWPYGVRGSYSAPVNFPQPGDYTLTVTPIGNGASSDGVSGFAEIPVSVQSADPVPSVGEMPPASATKTANDGQPLSELTTAYEPDAALYRHSIADAIVSGRPSVIVFATPAFCTSPTCGPQVDTVAELRAARPDAANYIHIELYDNPQEIQGDLARARLVPAAAEWGFTQLPEWTNESWVFVLDAGGVIRHRFEGFATLAELQAALSDAGG